MSCQRWWRPHRWSEWKACDVVVESPLIILLSRGKVGGPTIITGQARVCERCKEEELRA